MNAKRILVVESHAVRRQLLTAQLQELLPCQVLEATTGPAVICLVVREPLDLIVLDMQLPVREGWEVVRRIRALPAPERDVPILGFTAHARHDDAKKVVAAGCDDYIARPKSERSRGKVQARQLQPSPAARGEGQEAARRLGAARGAGIPGVQYRTRNVGLSSCLLLLS